VIDGGARGDRTGGAAESVQASSGPAEQRQAALRSLKEGPLDVLVIGGGTAGCDTWRKAALAWCGRRASRRRWSTAIAMLLPRMRILELRAPIALTLMVA
jgi:hypothetical protein